MLFVGARNVVCVSKTGDSTRQHLASPILKDNYKQMFLGSQCQLQSWGTVKVSVPLRVPPPPQLSFQFQLLDA